MASPTTKKSPTQTTPNSGWRTINPSSTTGSLVLSKSSINIIPISSTSTGGSASPPSSPRSSSLPPTTTIVPQCGTSSLFSPTNKSPCPPMSQPSTSNAGSSTPSASSPGKPTPQCPSTPGVMLSTTSTGRLNPSSINSSIPSRKTAISCSTSA